MASKLRPRETLNVAEDVTTADAAEPDDGTALSTLRESELDRLIKAHQGTLCDVLVTPALAKYILDHYNTANRKLRAVHVNSFAQTLARDGWINTGEPIIFARESILNNGQHRLEGIVRAGIPAVLDLRFGISREAFAVTDTGAKRQAGDILSISGSTYPFAAAAAIKLLLAYEQGLPASYTGANKTGNDQILAGFTRWPDLHHALELNYRTLKRRGFNNAASNAFTYLAMRQTDLTVAGEFLSIVDSGITRSKADAPRVLRERLLSDQVLISSTRGAVIERLALFIKSWGYWRTGERPRVLRWRTDEAFPAIDGVTL